MLKSKLVKLSSMNHIKEKNYYLNDNLIRHHDLTIINIKFTFILFVIKYRIYLCLHKQKGQFRLVDTNLVSRSGKGHLVRYA
jgi:hypothetical protein